MPRIGLMKEAIQRNLNKHNKNKNKKARGVGLHGALPTLHGNVERSHSHIQLLHALCSQVRLMGREATTMPPRT
jgi:hypothetical protein